jgi:hypothetical protein
MITPVTFPAQETQVETVGVFARRGANSRALAQLMMTAPEKTSAETFHILIKNC